MKPKKINGMNFIYQWSIFFIGNIMIQVGVAIFLALELGSDPFTVFVQGIAAVFAITPGMANRIITGLLLIVLWRMNKKAIGVGTIVSMLTAGTLLDGASYLFSPLALETLPLIVKLVVFMGACLIISIGFPTLKSAQLGVAPNDLLYLTFVDKLNKPYGVVRVVTDGLFFIVGVTLGGVIGIGTVLCTLCIGPMMQNMFPRVEKTKLHLDQKVHL